MAGYVILSLESFIESWYNFTFKVVDVLASFPMMVLFMLFMIVFIGGMAVGVDLGPKDK